MNHSFKAYANGMEEKVGEGRKRSGRRREEKEWIGKERIVGFLS